MGLVIRAYLDRQQSTCTDKDLDIWEVRHKEVLQMTKTFRKDFSRAGIGIELHRLTCGRLLAEMTACCISGLASVRVLNYFIFPQLVIPPVVCSYDSLAGRTVHKCSVTGCF